MKYLKPNLFLQIRHRSNWTDAFKCLKMVIYWYRTYAKAIRDGTIAYDRMKLEQLRGKHILVLWVRHIMKIHLTSMQRVTVGGVQIINWPISMLLSIFSVNFYSSNTNCSATGWYTSSLGFNSVAAMSRLQRSIRSIQCGLVSWWTSDTNYEQSTCWRTGGWYIGNTSRSGVRCRSLFVHGKY